MGNHYNHLTFDERRLIFQLREAKVSTPKIAERLGRHRSRIHRELRRNWFDDGPWLRGYFPMNAQADARSRRMRGRKLYRDMALAGSVIARLKDGWSPEQIAGHLQLEAGGRCQICHETIYQFVYGDRSHELCRLLPSRRRRRRARYARQPRGLSIPLANTLAQRPIEIGERTSFGHWECDLVMFRKASGQRNVLSLVERCSRFAIFQFNPSRHSKPIMATLSQDLAGLPPEARRTITFDRGTEFATHPALKTSLGVEAYFCAPQAPWQKGTVENTNGRLRRFMPIDTDVTEHTSAMLHALSARMSATPRKCLGFRTPAETFASLLRRCRG